jgi:protein phosphatase
MMKKIKIIDYISDKGLIREVNEDFYKIDEKKEIVIVSDGMGGHDRGDIASKIVTEKFYNELNEIVVEIDGESEEIATRLIKAYLQHAVEQASIDIQGYSDKYNDNNIMGATVAGVFHLNGYDKLAVFHLGDTRVYKISNESINLLTNDHVSTQTNNKNVLSKAIGNFDSFPIDLQFIEYNENDLFLVCTDGVYNNIKDKQIYDIITGERDISNMIKENVYNAGARDNLTAVILTME